MSLRARVLAGAVLIAMVLAVTAVVTTRTTRADLVDQVDGQLFNAFGSVRGLDLGLRNRARRPPRIADRPRQLSSLYVGYVTANGNLRAVVTPNLTGDDQPLPEIDAELAVAAAETGEPRTVGSGGPHLRYRMRAFVDGRSGAVVVLALPLDAVDDAVAGLVVLEVLTTGTTLAVLTLVAWWVVRLGVRPIKRMTAAATAIAGGNLSQRVPEAAPRTEAGELGTALNQMLGRIETAFEERTRSEDRLRQFVADASHELRTPLATVRGYAELFRTGGLDDAADLDDAMRRTEQEAVRMGTLVDDLLLLARLDQGRPLERAPVDLAALVDDAVRDACAVDPDRPIEAVVDRTVVVIGDEARLRQVIANIVGNAVVHSPAGTPIELRLDRQGVRAILAVSDRGPGMAPDVARRAFERFYRGDPSRSRHRGGSGLGLSIVQSTVDAHGGAATLHTAPGQGTTVRIELPVEGPPG